LKIIVSYRRDDSDGIAGRIRDHLIQRYGAQSVFMDIDSIPFGVDFQEHFSNALSDTNLLIAIIGKEWRGPLKRQKFRIDDPSDFVRLELEKAFQFGIRVLPVLVDEAKMPSSSLLPESLRRLASINAPSVSSGRDFAVHVDRMIKAVDAILDFKPNNRPARASSPATSIYRLATLGLLAALVAIGIFLVTQNLRIGTPEAKPARVADAVKTTTVPAISCDEEKNLHSEATKSPASIGFANIGNRTLRVYWLDHNGSRILYGTLEGGQVLGLQTYLTHPWVIADTKDNCIGIYLPTITALSLAVK
jgi:hypothetical protein